MARLGIVAALGAAIVVALAYFAFGPNQPESETSVATWPFINGDVHSMRKGAGAAHLSPQTAGQLETFWSVPLAGGVKLATPISDGESLYLPTSASRLYRINRRTGAIEWEIAIPDVVDVPGATVRSSVAVTAGKVIFGLRNAPFVVALDSASGALLWKTKIDEHRFAQVAQSPIVGDGKVFLSLTGVSEEAMPALNPNYECCTFRGSTVALDVSTGALLWKTYVLPEGFAGASIWSASGAYDAKRRTVYITTGNAYLGPKEVQDCVIANAGDEGAQAACHPDGVWYDSIVAFDADTGAIKWGYRGRHDDFFTAGCLQFNGAPLKDCGEGPDYDFGTAPMMWTAGGREFVGAGQKSGVFWALDPDSGAVVWQAFSGSAGPLGGMEFGTATDGQRIYFADSNAKFPTRAPQPTEMTSGEVISYGSVGAFDATTGTRIWQVADPAGVAVSGNAEDCDSLAGTGANCTGPYLKAPVTVANGVVFTCSIEPDGQMYAFDARDGSLLWRFKSGASCESGPAVMDGVVYWASGQTLRAFAVPGSGAENVVARTGTMEMAAISGRTVRDGVYAQAQADTGREVYLKSCAAGCHMETLSGNGPALALAGETFVARWRGLSVEDLFKRIRDTMPVDNPAGLSEAEYLAVTSFILSENGFPAGAQNLTAGQDMAVSRIVAPN